MFMRGVQVQLQRTHVRVGSFRVMIKGSFYTRAYG
jgi:hypothetical protein